MEHALTINDNSVESAFLSLYSNIASCYEVLGDPDKASENYMLATSFKDKPADKGPFYHGTKADLQVGDLLTPGGSSNYQSELKMNHIYLTALVNSAGLAASLARRNPTRSYRLEAPLKIVGEVTDWAKQTPENIQKWREKLANKEGQIIN